MKEVAKELIGKTKVTLLFVLFSKPRKLGIHRYFPAGHNNKEKKKKIVQVQSDRDFLKMF